MARATFTIVVSRIDMIEPSTTTALIRQTCDSIAAPASPINRISFGTESFGTEPYTNSLAAESGVTESAFRLREA